MAVSRFYLLPCLMCVCHCLGERPPNCLGLRRG
uniref:Uncharacterized protein n=1 Tax=Arundo donax TaxID=35708 RepID=A0A0A9SUN5_ARUDO